MAKKKKPEFIDRVLNPQKYPYIYGSVSTHEMAAEVDENGNWFVFPYNSIRWKNFTAF